LGGKKGDPGAFRTPGLTVACRNRLIFLLLSAKTVEKWSFPGEVGHNGRKVRAYAGVCAGVDTAWKKALQEVKNIRAGHKRSITEYLLTRLQIVRAGLEKDSDRAKVISC
jgi:hypothetical protein